MDKYDTSNDHYCYPNTAVLKNKLGITDEKALEEAEREITKTSTLDVKSYNPPYHLQYLQHIHASLFSELYDWAGQIRDVKISKGGTSFCIAPRIIPEIGKLFKKLEDENYLQNLSNDKFVTRLAWYYAEFNMVHPFREGNGRVQRLFFEHLAAYNGYALDWSVISQEEWINANIDSVYVDSQRLADIFERVLKVR
ncbi:MAG: putative adenosine monophosphate-protein transferase Fic [Methylobacter sp.]|jgi:cell filamentation protein|nr:putative adenosine monophosphate-protein transferase Fic [Methylobacter sp.]